MMAARGFGLVRRIVLGSVTAKTLHDTSVPVWTGAGRVLADHFPGIPYESILCSFDGSEEAESVLRGAA